MPVLYQLSFTGFKGTEKQFNFLVTLSLLITIKKNPLKKLLLSKRHLSA